MDELHDFSDIDLSVSIYDGASGKRTMILDGTRYMVKFGYQIDESARREDRASYIDIPVNEYLGSRIFSQAGLPTQSVMLGTWRGHSVVACRDFMQDYPAGWDLVHFKQLEISMPGESGRSKARPDLEFVSHVIDDSQDLEGLRDETWRRYRQMLCVDALIGNYDRHSNNWGFIADRKAQLRELAPIYDCGSSLMPHLSSDAMRQRLRNPAEMRQRNLDSPTMAMNVGRKRRKYAYFLLSDVGRPFRAELPALWRSLDPDELGEVVEDTPGLDNLHKDFYRATLAVRHDCILLPAVELASEELDAGIEAAPAPEAPMQQEGFQRWQGIQGSNFDGPGI